MANENTIFINPVEKHLSVITRYQYYVLFFIFCSKFTIFWHILNLIFLSPPMDYHCNSTDTVSSVVKNMCPCEEPLWDRKIFTATMQTKFSITCESNWLIHFSQSMAFAGALVGSLIFGFLSDKFGRVSIFSASSLIVAVAGCLVSVMPTAAAFTCMRFIEGIGVGGTIVTSYVICIEYCGAHHREVVSALFHIPIFFSHIALPGVSYLLRDFDDFQLAISIPVFLSAAAKWMIFETPKWLMDNNHIEKAATVMEKFSSTRSSNLEIRDEIETYLATHAKNSQRNVKFWEIFMHKKLSLTLVNMSIIYFVCGMGYYGVSQFIGKMSGDVHANVAVSGLLLLPGIIICALFLPVIPRRIFLMTTNLLSGLLILAVICVPAKMNWVRVVLACICNSFFFISFIVAMLYGAELFPTSVRSSVLGTLSVFARFGQMINPPINSLSQTNAGAIYGTFAIIGGILCYFLPETMNTELPSSLEDAQILYNNNTLNVDNNNQSTEPSPEPPN